MPAGKTIGRHKPAPDFSRVEEGVRIYDTVAESIATGVAYHESEKPTTTERGLRSKVVLLQRRLDQSEARLSVIVNGGDRSSLSRPSGDAFEWMREFTTRMLAMGDMNDEARKAAFDKMLADVKAVEERKTNYARDVELDAADFAAKRKRGGRPDGD